MSERERERAKEGEEGEENERGEEGEEKGGRERGERRRWIGRGEEGGGRLVDTLSLPCSHTCCTYSLPN